jgi:hypothetical protein
MIQALHFVSYHQEKSWNGIKIKEELKDEVTAEEHEECLDR